MPATRPERRWLLVSHVNTKQSTRITEGTAWEVSSAPSWSPDSKKIVFGTATTPLLRDNRRDVYIADIATKAVEKISTNWGIDSNPRWSQDGATIAWVGEPNSTAPLTMWTSFRRR